MIYLGIKTAKEIVDKPSTVKEFSDNQYHVFATPGNHTIGIPFKTHEDKNAAQIRATEIQAVLWKNGSIAKFV